MNFENTTHIFAQNKGGIGKTLSCSMFIQFLRDNEIAFAGADLDEQATKLALIKDLKAHLFKLMDHGEIQQIKFDPLFQTIVQNPVASILDSGSATLMPLLKYLADNFCYDILDEAGKQLYYHMVIISGPEKENTAKGVETLLDKTRGTNVKVVIWQNEKQGIPTFDGKTVEELDWYLANRDRIAGVVKIEDRNNSAYTATFLKMMDSSLTYREIMQDGANGFNFMEKKRIDTIFKSVYGELGELFKSQFKPAYKEKKAS